MEIIKKPGENLVFSVNGVAVVTIKDAAPGPNPNPQPTTGKIPHTVTADSVQIPGVGRAHKNRIIIDNDFATDSPEFPLLFLAADKGIINLAGMIMHSTLDPDWPFERTQMHWASTMAAAKGMKNIPAPVKGSTRELQKPSNGNVDSTTPENSAGADLIIREAKLSSPEKPLIVFMGGQSSTVASAYLKDKSIAPNMIVFHINGYWDGGKDGYNTADPWATQVIADKLKYICVNVKFPEARKYWYDNKNMGLNASLVGSLPNHPASNMLKKWFTDAFVREGLADSPAVLWYFNNKLWRDVARKKLNGSTTTGNDYDFLFITQHDWPAYGATLINTMKELLSDAPPVTGTPIGGITTGIEEAIRTAGEGRTVKVAPGLRFPLPPLNIKNITIDFGGSAITSTTQGHEGGGDKRGILNIVGSNVEIINAVFAGENKGYAAIMGGNGKGVKLRNVKIHDFNFTGAWLQKVQDLLVTECEFKNTAWADSRYMTGGLMINDVNGFLIDGNQFTSTKDSKGTGIESNTLGNTKRSGQSDIETTLTNGKVLNNRFDLSHHNPWNNGASQNFSIEFHAVHLHGVEIAHNVINNEISLASRRPSNGHKTLIHHNTGNLSGDYFFVEAILDDLEVYDNEIQGVRMFSANFQKNGMWKNHVYRRNTVRNPAPPLSWGKCWIMAGPDGVQNYLVENNNFPSDREMVQYQHVRGGVIIR